MPPVASKVTPLASAEAELPVERRAGSCPVASGRKFRAVTAGQQHTYALTNDGIAYCWGLNNQAELGNNLQRGAGDEILHSLVPVAVAGGLTFK